MGVNRDAWSEGRRKAAVEFAKLGARGTVLLGLPLIAGGLVARGMSEAAGWLVAILLGGFGAAVGVPSLLRRLPNLTIDRQFWHEQGELRLDVMRRRSGPMWWTLVTLSTLVATVLIVIVAVKITST